MRNAVLAVLSVAAVLVVGTTAVAHGAPNRAYPDTADHNTLITLRNGVRHDAVQMLGRIAACERKTHDPYGTGRNAFNHCITTLLNVNLLKSRYEQVMMLGVLHDLARGRCLGLASGLMESISELGNEAETWFGDAENPDAAAAALEQADAHDMRSIAHGILALTGSRLWRTACRPRPYDPTEAHPVRARAPARPARQTLVLPWPASGSLALVA